MTTRATSVTSIDQTSTIIALLCHGEPISRIATILHVSVSTVEAVLEKYGRLIG